MPSSFRNSHLDCHSERSALANDERPKTDDGFSGGADRDRTGGLLVANQALSQLSYSPNPVVRLWPSVVRKKPTTNDARPTTDKMVGLGRVELPTSSLSGMRSSQLSYRPGWFCKLRPTPGAQNHNSAISSQPSAISKN